MRNLRVRLVTGIFFYSVWAASSLAHAQDKEDAWLPYCKRAVALSATRIAPHLPEDIKHLSKKVVVVPSADFNAAAFGGNVFVSVGVCFELALIAEAWIYAYKTPEYLHHLQKYQMYLVSVRDRETQNPALVPLNRKNFGGFVGKEFSPLAKEDLRIYEPLVLDGLAWLLAHEFGHHSLGHTQTPPTSSANSKFRELKADDFAIDIFKKLSVEVGAGTGVLFQFLANSKAHPDYIKIGSHPRTECRLERLFRKLQYISKIEKDKVLRSRFEKGSGMTISEFKALMEEFYEDCQDNP